MPEIVGEFYTVTTTIPPLDAHIGHLRHLTNLGIAERLLRESHSLTTTQSRNTSKLLASHVAQALDFHVESRNARPTIRPVLQYYSYLNLAVAAILAFRPTGFDGYGSHGVQDLAKN